MQLLTTAFISGLALANAQSAPVPGVTGKLGDAQVVTDNPAGVTYVATLPDKPSTNIRGSISATANAGGTGVTFNVNFYGFPSESLGPFLYHIHDQPVPSSGNCTATLAHLDPTERGEKPPCDPSNPASCQVGDLAGKHGNITSPGIATTYSELYASTKSGLGAFFGNRSIVIHTSNTTRLTCANFVLSNSSASASGSAAPSGTGSIIPPSTSPIAPFVGGATANFVSGSVVVGLAVAVVALLL